MNLIRAQLKPVIIGFTAAAFLLFAVRDASSGGGNPFQGLLFEFAIYGIPLIVFELVLWSIKWSKVINGSRPLSMRNRITVAGEILVLTSSGLYLLTLPFSSAIAQNESLGACWLYAGSGCALAAVVCSVAGSPRSWLNALASAMLLPCWLFLAAIMAKMMMD